MNVSKAKQTSESIELGVLLAISGGMMDAYSYMARGKVFANAQTGNMLLFGVYLSQGEFAKAMHYFCPIIAFTIGIAMADLVRMKGNKRLHWRQLSVLLEAVILFVVGFISMNMNLLANSLTSLACGIQVESFRKIHGRGIATTMCIGNLRSGTENLYHYFHTKERHFLDTTLLYYGIIACFIVGAVIGNAAVQLFQTKAILGCSFLLLISFFMMFINWEKKEKELAP